jgi:Mrp family chromosome partitioning ATPase
MAIDSGLTSRLRRQLARGELVLFTGAGFSYTAVSISGQPVPSVSTLRLELWRLAFPSDPVIDDRSTLGDIFELACARARNSTRDLLHDLLSIDAAKSPERFGAWFSLPWFRHYTLNIDDLDEATAAHFSLPRPLHSLAAQTDPLFMQPGLLSIHLNGRFRDYPDITFSLRQYGQRASQPDPWYQSLVTDLLNRPVLFIGTELDELGLWQYIELRRQRSANEVEMRPASYLVSPSIPIARAGLLKRFNVNWIEATEEDFFNVVLADATAEAEIGLAELRRRTQHTTPSAALHPLAELRLQPAVDELSVFLIGRTPTWADIQDGFAVERWFEQGLLTDVLNAKYDIVLLTGTAACGKSTTAMRLALALEAGGRKTYVLDTTEGSWNVGAVSQAVRQAQPDVLLIDDVDIFGSATPRLLRELSALPSHPLVLAAIRSSRLQGLDLIEEIADMNVLERTVPSLHDQDIDALIEALTRANRLGKLAGQSPAQRRQVFSSQAGRQLVVAMYYATSGEKLQDRVFSECEDLTGSSRLAYGMTALATTERQWITREELLFGLGAIGPSTPSNQELNDVQKLVDRELILTHKGELRLRHRWIAETALEFYIANGLITGVVKAFAFVLAVRVDPQMSWNRRERKLLRRIINHDFLIRTVADAAGIREIYSFLEDVLAWDYHYWLQRGSFEVEAGDLALAENFLNSARSLAPDRDYYVDTEYAYLMLKNSAKNPRGLDAVELAEKALLDLEDVMRIYGAQDSYSFHVYGSQGLSWARRATMTRDARLSLLKRLFDAVSRGCDVHPSNRDLRQLKEDLQRECMMTTVASIP